MCGIAGYAGSRELDARTIERCLRLMHHRGPDAAGFATFHGVGGANAYLLSTRLDIIDLMERSNQPFRAGSKTLVYNGELYNYLELRAALQAKGRAFETESDTEVMIAALDEGGDGALDGCEGMWAFALADERDGTLTLCRDRFGEKPLFVYRDETGLYFGSEPAFVFSLLGRQLPPDLDQLSRYLVNGYKALHKSGRTFHEGLLELAPATVLTLDRAGRETGRHYWSPVAVGQDDSLERREAVAAVRDRMIRTVELRLRADVPLAFCLSGGVDSLSLISIAKRMLGYDVHGFTIVNEDERYDERDLVDLAVRELDLRHTALSTRSAGFLATMREIVSHRNAPVATISYYVHWLLMRAIGDAGYRISVSGVAGDEIFSGYYDHHLAYLHEVRNEPAYHGPALRAWQKHVLPHVRNPYLSRADLFTADPEERGYIYLNADEFSARLTTRWAEAFTEKRYVDDLLRNRMLNEMTTETIPVLLHEDDANAMQFSIENRAPFLDRELFETAASIPTRELVRDGYAKSILRDAMRGIVPDPVLDSRRKVGFNAPMTDMLDDETRAYLTADGPIWDIVRRDAVASMLERPTLPNSESKFLFNVLNAKLFLETAAA